MGIISDIYEATRDRPGRWRVWRDESTAGDWPPKPLNACPMCSAAFSAPKDVEDHVFAVHRHVHVYLRLNGQVYCERTIRGTTPVTELSVHFGGGASREVRLRIWSDQGALPVSLVVESSDLAHIERFIPTDRLYCLKLDIGQSKSYEVVFSGNRQLRLEPLDALVAGLEEELARSPREVNWPGWKQRFSLASSDRAEVAYLDGHFDYLMAYRLETEKLQTSEAAPLLARAFGTLRGYGHAKAASVCRAVAFKMNWFDSVDTHPGSPFHEATRFFTTPFEDRGAEAASTEGVAGTETRILLDPFHESILSIVSRLAREGWNALREPVEDLLNSPAFLSDRNHSDKARLIAARAARALGDGASALEHYDALLDHYLFQGEANDFGRTARGAEGVISAEGTGTAADGANRRLPPTGEWRLGLLARFWDWLLRALRVGPSRQRARKRGSARSGG